MATVTSPSPASISVCSRDFPVSRVCLRRKEQANATTMPYSAERIVEKPPISVAISTTTQIRVCQFCPQTFLKSGILSSLMPWISQRIASKCTMQNTEPKYSTEGITAASAMVR